MVCGSARLCNWFEVRACANACAPSLVFSCLSIATRVVACDVSALRYARAPTRVRLTWCFSMFEVLRVWLRVVCPRLGTRVFQYVCA
jgi:hypothetical protein